MTIFKAMNFQGIYYLSNSHNSSRPVTKIHHGHTVCIGTVWMHTRRHANKQIYQYQNSLNSEE